MRTCLFHRQKVILLFLFLSQIFGYFGGSSGQEVIRAVGDTVTFDTSVPVSGTLLYKGGTVGQVLNKQSDTSSSEKFVNRLHWDSQTGFFTLSDLRTEDSGRYTVDSTRDPKRKQDYELEVYERVSAPQVKNTTDNSSEFCSVQCSVRNDRGLYLSLYEDDVLLNHSSSNNNNSILNLHLEIKKTDNRRSKTFICVSSNPVSNEKTQINLSHYCTPDPDKTESSQLAQDWLLPVIFAVIFVVLIIVMTICLYLRKKKQNEASRQTEDSSATEGLNEEVHYSEINHRNPMQPNIPEPANEEATLTTIYDRVTFGRTSD